MIQTTLCIRCGSTRIVAKRWEKDGIIFIQTVCPDKKCQKIVERQLEKRNEHLASLQATSAERRKSIQLGRQKYSKVPPIFKKN